MRVAGLTPAMLKYTKGLQRRLLTAVQRWRVPYKTAMKLKNIKIIATRKLNVAFKTLYENLREMHTTKQLINNVMYAVKKPQVMPLSIGVPKVPSPR